ncbi:MAG: hypothetical protein K9G71_14445 [Rhodobacteraceae bacterium]|nr:hypothetical protein [Paracoccaceae bacterium]MCF8515549.1 hypothetical protein [Paracoccaceae bacterium]MCF8519794.1 hypothetical protein [Paracoccaceae bacterium]
MTRSLTAALIALLVLTSCGKVRDSRLNPFNWFGRSEQTETLQTVQKPADPRPLVADVVSMNVEPYSGGAIVRATGISPTQGYWDAELVELENDEPGHLILEFRLFPPVAEQGVNTPRSREVTVAMTLSPARLENISRITVQGASNARTTRR